MPFTEEDTDLHLHEVAVNPAVDAILHVQRRILIFLAIDMSRAFVSLQNLWTLVKSGQYANPFILILIDSLRFLMWDPTEEA